jgi:hypothetical protein
MNSSSNASRLSRLPAPLPHSKSAFFVNNIKRNLSGASHYFSTRIVFHKLYHQKEVAIETVGRRKDKDSISC